MFRAYCGDNGGHWTEIGTGIPRPSLPATLRVGLLAWPFNANAAFAAQFDNFEILTPGGATSGGEQRVTFLRIVLDSLGEIG